MYTALKKRRDGHELDAETRTYNKLMKALRCLSERGFAMLVGRWKALRHVTMSLRRQARRPAQLSSRPISDTG